MLGWKHFIFIWIVGAPIGVSAAFGAIGFLHMVIGINPGTFAGLISAITVTGVMAYAIIPVRWAEAQAKRQRAATRRAFSAAIDFAIDEGLDASEFLLCWREGDWQAIEEDWPEFDLTTTGQWPVTKVGE